MQIIYIKKTASKDIQKLMRQLESLLQISKNSSREWEIIIDQQNRQKIQGSVYGKMLERLGDRDLLVLDSLSSLGRTKREIVKALETLEAKHVNLRVLDIASTFQESASTVSVLRDVYDNLAFDEVTKLKENQRSGIDRAKEDHKILGRPLTPYPENWESDYRLWKNGVITSKEFLNRSGLKKGTFYNLLKRYRLENESGTGRDINETKNTEQDSIEVV